MSSRVESKTTTHDYDVFCYAKPEGLCFFGERNGNLTFESKQLNSYGGPGESDAQVDSQGSTRTVRFAWAGPGIRMPSGPLSGMYCAK